MSSHSWSVPSPEQVASLTYWELAEHLRLARLNSERYVAVHSLLQSEASARSPTAGYKCQKCAHGAFEVHKMRTSRSLLGSLFNLDSAQYTAVVCARCAFTEFYNGVVPAGEQALDFIFGR